MSKDDIPIEKTRCGSCQHLFDNTCPHGNRRGILVPSFFADHCACYKSIPIALFEASDYREVEAK